MSDTYQKMARRILTLMKLPKECETKLSDDNVIIYINRSHHEQLEIYVGPDIYTPGHPLQITDDTNTLTMARIGLHASYDINKIDDYMYKHHVYRLEGFDEILTDTKWETLNKDVNNYIKVIEHVADMIGL